MTYRARQLEPQTGRPHRDERPPAGPLTYRGTILNGPLVEPQNEQRAAITTLAEQLSPRTTIRGRTATVGCGVRCPPGAGEAVQPRSPSASSRAPLTAP